MSEPQRQPSFQDTLPGEGGGYAEMPVIGHTTPGVHSPSTPHTSAPVTTSGTRVGSGIPQIAVFGDIEKTTPGAMGLAVSVFGRVRRSGPWTLPSTSTTVAVFGEIVLDLRDAVLDGPEIKVNAVTVFGDVKVIVPPGVAVDTEGLIVFGDRRMRLDVTPPAGAPRVVVRAVGAFSDVKVEQRERGA